MDVHAPHRHGRFLRGTTLKARFRANRRHTMVSAHRGLWDPLPENSLAAIRAAATCDVVEVDVRLDQQGTPYLMHDDTLERMTGADQGAADVSCADLAELRLREGAGGPDAPATDEPVPTLDQAFQALDGTGAIFDLDVKRAEDIEAVANSVAALGCQDLATLKMRVETTEDIAKLVALEEQFDIMVIAKIALRSGDDLPLVVSLREADVAAVEVRFDDLNLLRRATSFAGDLMRFGTYTLDNTHCCGLSDTRALRDPGAVWGRLLGAGIRLIMTDQPEALSRYLLTR
ncbi:MAG: glycerophosphodiester phosphodiesterase family protein [Pseudomonadota bacterium]